jgi:hypothetical protein
MNQNSSVPKWIKGRREEQSASEFAGLIRGLLADGNLSEAECDYLRDWILRNHGILSDPMARLVAVEVIKLYQPASSRSVNELARVSELLQGYAPRNGEPVAIPFDDGTWINFRRKRFCLTGVFTFGSREVCAAEIEKRGGIVDDKVTPGLKYLVVGAEPSPRWIQAGYGGKIIDAVALHGTPDRPLLISESDWVAALAKNAPLRPKGSPPRTEEEVAAAMERFNSMLGEVFPVPIATDQPPSNSPDDSEVK